MDKLPHEKLRWWVEESKKEDNYPSSIMVVEYDFYGVKGERKAFHQLADEIEEAYIPRSEHEAEIKRIVEAQGWDEYKEGCPHQVMEAYAAFNGMPMEDGESISKWLDRWFVKRLYPNRGKVYDVDGVEIKVGDTVYEVEDGHKSIVSRNDSCNSDRSPIICKDGCFGDLRYKPEELTHERPVFYADGERIKVGDTVWNFEGVKGIVKGINRSEATVYVEWEDGRWSPYILPDSLTHREPDSLEKLRDDILDHGNTKSKEYWADRLTALIERGA